MRLVCKLRKLLLPDVILYLSGDLVKKRVLVLGAYGLIGAAITRALIEHGHHVEGFGRNETDAKRAFPSINWIFGDITNNLNVDQWSARLANFDMVVNCTGILQDQGVDLLKVVHTDFLEMLAQSCKATETHLIQISAVGAELNASSAFLRTKGQGDQHVQNCEYLKFHIFRPGLVIARTSYGGSTLLRMVASSPFVLPMAFPNSKIQTVALSDIASCVLKAANGDIKPNSVYDLVEPKAHDLKTILREFRVWLGFGQARMEMRVPMIVVRGFNIASDALGKLGWKSPLRSTASKVLEDGIQASSAKIEVELGRSLKTLHETLYAMPSQIEDRIFARMQILKPIIISLLALFWMLSGLIGLIKIDEAATTLTNVGWPLGLAFVSVGFWSLVDIALALLISIRRFARQACWAMVAVSLIYLGFATLITPHLWLDPLGPLVKVIPSIILALVARVSLEVR